MEHLLDISKAAVKSLKPLSDKFKGTDPDGNVISFNNYYMEFNGQPWMGISGECHFARVHEDQWEDTILKMKMGGVNIIATYVFWNHHEEVEGQFRFDGRRNIRRFVELCKKHGMYVIVRIGPFCHGEARNGGLPDWLYGKPFEVRTMDEGFLRYVRRLYQRLGEQLEGLCFKDGGPIIAAQLDNEFMHCGAPWEMTTGVSRERTCSGEGGDEYLLTLKRFAQEAGILTPFYTCTGWGGAPAPSEEMLPLWGGYAYCPWMFTDGTGEHPATECYLYQDYHNHDLHHGATDYGAFYDVETVPYACCEMGGGMACFYYYRFQLPYESVDAMANVKLASGCNFLGYYVYRGGSNPTGETIPYLNEYLCPKISYDYQAAMGEYGQLRPSYHRLRAIHIFLKNFQKQFCGLTTVLPENAAKLVPQDVQTLRYAVRTDRERGFVFLNNYQDHVEGQPKYHETIRLQTNSGEIVIPEISLSAGEEAILPFGLDVEGYQLVYAKAQLLTSLKKEGHAVYFFFIPDGMDGEYVWEAKGIRQIINGSAEECPDREKGGRTVRVRPASDVMSSYIIDGEYGKVEIVTLTRQQSLRFYEMEINGQKTAVLCDTAITFDGKTVRVENPENGAKAELLLYPPMGQKAFGVQNGQGICTALAKEGIFEGISICWNEGKTVPQILQPVQCGPSRYVLRIPEGWAGCKDVILQIDYLGDIGQAFVDGKLIADNFCNNAVWEIGLKEAWDKTLTCGEENEITLLITPLKENVRLDVSDMAGQNEVADNVTAVLRKIQIRPVREAELTLEQ